MHVKSMATTTSDNSENSESESQSFSEFVVLTEVVRKHYVRYLERQLEENVLTWAKKSNNLRKKPAAWACIAQSVKVLETQAVNACMAAQVYQRVMVKMIASVRRSTQQCRLADSIFNEIKSPRSLSPAQTDRLIAPCFVEKSTQTFMPNSNDEESNNCNLDTDGYAQFTLQQKIDLLQNKLVEPSKATLHRVPRSRSSSYSKRKRRKQKKNEMEVAMASPVAQSPVSATEDAVAQELAMLFGDEPTDFNEIFGIEPSAGTDDPHVCAILHEIENAQLPSAKTTTPPQAQEVQERSEVDLRNSIWPCELHAHRRQLNNCIVSLLEADWRYEETLRYQFKLLFGDDSDDEFSAGISSPSIDLVDEVLLSSCILRIRPWIVRHLMPPLQEGLIANRFLFKKLAKMLANNIVLANSYATETQVKQAVEYLFCMKPDGVQSAYDLDGLPTLELECL